MLKGATLILVQMDSSWKTEVFEMDLENKVWIKKNADYMISGHFATIYNRQPQTTWTNKVDFQYESPAPVQGTLEPEVALEIAVEYLKKHENLRNIVFCINPPS